MAGIPPKTCSNFFCLRPAFGGGKCGVHRSKRSKR